MEIEAEGIVVRRDGRTILSGGNVQVRSGQALALVGPSGSGKTTMLNALGLLIRVDRGRVVVDGKETTRWNDSARRRFWQRHATFVFQDSGLIDEESIAYNILLARLPLFGVRKSDVHAVGDVLERVGLDGRGLDLVSTLSGGEKQRVGLARAMYRGADVVFADEPTASLDRNNREHVTQFLLGEAARGATVVIATHDDALMNSCDAVLDVEAFQA